VIEENGELLARLVPIEKFEPKRLILGLREGQVLDERRF
jgi:antitoxin (DNA-binding transcriptional repressor) of toxin-antitoxin stability system